MPNRAPSFPRYLNLLPHSVFWDTLDFESPHVRMLFSLDPPCLARTLFSIAEIMGDSFWINIYDNEYLPNFGFILFSDQKNVDETDEPEAAKGISKKELVKDLQQNGFINIRDEKSDKKRTFVDCLLHRNVDLERLYYLIRKSMPMLSSKRRAKQFLNVLSYTSTKKASTLLCQKNMNKIGLMNRFIFINDDTCDRHDSANEISETIIKTVIDVYSKIKKSSPTTEIKYINHANDKDIDYINTQCAYINSRLSKCQFVKNDANNLTELYRSTIIKIYFILLFIRKKQKLRSPMAAWPLADTLARILINEKIYLLEKTSKNKQLYDKLLGLLKTKKSITLREIKRKFQYADKAVLNFYINHLLRLGILSRSFITEFKGKKLPQLFYVSDENIEYDRIEWELHPPSITKTSETVRLHLSPSLRFSTRLSLSSRLRRRKRLSFPALR